MPKPYITALIDTYNQGRFVEEAIESVLAQDFPMNEVEIIVVDDGSTDDTPARIRRFAGRIRYIRKPNGGQASALNAGFAAAQGQIIAFLDGDDTWRANKLTRVAAAFEASPRAILCYHPMTFIDERTGRVLPHSGFDAISGDVLSSINCALRYGNISTSSMALRRRLAAPLFPIPADMRIYADSYLAYSAIFLDPVVALTEALTHYRIHDANLASGAHNSAAKLTERLRSFQSALLAINRFLAERNITVTLPGAAFLKRQELVAAMLAHTCRAPSRAAYASYWREFNQLYAPLWNPPYRAFRALVPVLAAVLGYSGFESLQKAYAKSSLPELRERWLASRDKTIGRSWPKQQHAAF